MSKKLSEREKLVKAVEDRTHMLVDIYLAHWEAEQLTQHFINIAKQKLANYDAQIAGIIRLCRTGK